MNDKDHTCLMLTEEGDYYVLYCRHYAHSGAMDEAERLSKFPPYDKARCIAVVDGKVPMMHVGG